MELKIPRQPFIAALALAVLLGGMTAAEQAGYFSTGQPPETLTGAVLPGAVIALTNEERQQKGAATVKANSLLNQAAQMKADDMASKSYYSHISPDGTIPPYWLNKVGYKYAAMGENLVIDRESSEAVVSAWMGSDSHRENMLNPELTEIGVGIAKGNYKGRDTIYVVQMLARPQREEAPTKVVEKPKPVQVRPQPKEPVPVRSAATTSVLVRQPVPKPVIRDDIKLVIEAIASTTLVEVPSIIADVTIAQPPPDPAFTTEPIVVLNPATTTLSVHTPIRAKLRSFMNEIGFQMKSFFSPLY